MKITAKVIQHSKSIYTDREIITFELEYPRYIHAEFMTHRLFSRNAASSRAIPVEAMQAQILEQDVDFIFYGKNQPGMQAKEELDVDSISEIKALWKLARDCCLSIGKVMHSKGLHKQNINRLHEPWMMMKTVVTTTDIANWDWLRNHSDAQPEIQELAKVMYAARLESVPEAIGHGEWHVPYVTRTRHDLNNVIMYGDDGFLTVEEARIISASCCAQVSYRKNDDSLEKAQNIFDKLVNSAPVHASPTEHQASPIDYDFHMPDGFPHDLEWLTENGITAYNTDGTLSSGNFRDWIQFRQLIPNNAKW